MAVTAMKPKNAVESLREVVQDLLVPELKAVKVSIDSLRSEMGTSLESIRTEMKLRDDKQTAGINHVADNLKQLSLKLDQTLEIRERLAAMEARLSKS